MFNLILEITNKHVNVQTLGKLLISQKLKVSITSITVVIELKQDSNYSLSLIESVYLINTI